MFIDELQKKLKSKLKIDLDIFMLLGKLVPENLLFYKLWLDKIYLIETE